MNIYFEYLVRELGSFMRQEADTIMQATQFEIENSWFDKDDDDNGTMRRRQLFGNGEDQLIF